MILGRARTIFPAFALTTLVAISNYCAIQARAQSNSAPLSVRVAPGLPCFDNEALRNAVVQDLGEAFVQGWRLALERPKHHALRLSLFRGRRRIGTRSFTNLPDDCLAQRRLVAAVVSLAIENWRSEKEPHEVAAKTARRQKSARKRSAAARRPTASQDPQPPRDSVQAPRASEQEAGPDSAGNPPLAQEANRQGESAGQKTSSAAEQGLQSAPQREQAKPSPAQADPRALARAQARENRRRPVRREAFRLEKGLGLGVLWGSLAQPGPELSGWLAAKRPRLSLRARIHLAYGVPRRLGPARVHTALALFALEVCGRGASAPAGALEFWACVGWQGGSLWGGGARSDQNLQGFRPFTAPTLAVEFPLAYRRGQHFLLRVQGGANLLRTRLELQDFDQQQGIVHRYLLPAYHVALSVGWRR